MFADVRLWSCEDHGAEDKNDKLEDKNERLRFDDFIPADGWIKNKLAFKVYFVFTLRGMNPVVESKTTDDHKVNKKCESCRHKSDFCHNRIHRGDWCLA